ncbi:MAG: SDR family oxidoreductase [Nitrospiraceae bacterium]|nr:SDR family oxidoreductase [Nitrospiraceae bacterium]
MTNDAPANAGNVVVVGATSSVARATAGEFARAGHGVILAARDMDANERMASDLRVRYETPVETVAFEADDLTEHAQLLERCQERADGPIDGIVFCAGFMDEQAAAQDGFAVAHRTIDVNYTAAVAVIEPFAAHFEERRSGFIAVLGSVAGDRGRQSNYIYGSAKAGLHAYLEGLRNRLFPADVFVTTVKPGFMDTKMSFGLPGLFLVMSPEAAGKAIYKAIHNRKNVAYVPWFWRYIMLIIRHVPEFVFKRMKM